MPRVLLTGMSGTGKSSVVAALAASGVRAIDADDPAWSHWVDVPADDPTPGTPVEPGRDWVWRDERIAALLDEAAPRGLVIAGCSPGMSRFRPRFDHVVLLTAPDAVLLERLAARTTNPYGKGPGEAQRVLDLVRTVEPHLRRLADVVIDSTTPLAEVVARVAGLAQGRVG